MSGYYSMHLTMGIRTSSLCLLMIMGFLQFQDSLTLIMPIDVNNRFISVARDCERRSLQYLNECCPLFEYAELRCTGQPFSVSDDVISFCRTVVSLSDSILTTTMAARLAFIRISNTCRERAQEYQTHCCPRYDSSHLECINV